MAAAIAARVYFCIGPIFSDDAFYNYLAYTLWQGDFAKDYLGYGTCLLRVNTLVLTALAYAIFGANEFATMIFPMLFSLANVALAYHLAKLWTGAENVARVSALLMAFLPTDVIFATINFTDSPSALFINLGIYFLYRAHVRQNLCDSLVSGLCFFLSIQFKINAFYAAIPLAALLIYVLLRSKKTCVYLLVPLLFIAGNFALEALIYGWMRGDFFYHLNLLENNNRFARNFFLVRGGNAPADFTAAMLKRALVLNPRFVFLRRFHLFLPALAALHGALLWHKKQHRLLVYWFAGLCLVFIVFTTSFSRYQPLNLWFSWYIFPLFMPAVLLSALLLARLPARLRQVLILLYLAGSVIMCQRYESNLGKPGLQALRMLLRQHPDKIVFTDHHTQAALDLIDGYRTPLRTRRIPGESFDWQAVQKNDWILVHHLHVTEQKFLDFRFPDFSVLQPPEFEVILQRKDFTVFEKRR